MKATILAAVVNEMGHTVVVQNKPDEMKVFPASNRNYFISIAIGPVAWELASRGKAVLDKDNKPTGQFQIVDVDLKCVRIGGQALKEKGVSLEHDAIIDGPRRKNGELQHSTWPMQIALGHKDAESALRLAMQNMLGIKASKPALTPEQEAAALQAGQEYMAGNLK
jgi:hypothetical protein